MKKNQKILDSLTSAYQDLDLEEMEAPNYLTSLEKPSEKTNPERQLTHFIEDVWVPEPELVEKSLSQLEEQDRLYRSRISQVSESEKNKASQLNHQRQLYKELLEIGVKIHQLPSFSTLEGFTKNIRKILKALVALQNKISPFPKGKIKNIAENSQKIWDWMTELAREWSTRVDLRIGADIIEQVMREAEKKHDFDIQVHIMRELKTENTVIAHNKSEKKPKHKFSKHRKLKFDVHEKLQNFMTPEYAQWDTKHENLLKTLFGKKMHSDEKVFLDIPLV